jgi:hypothetical protein
LAEAAEADLEALAVDHPEAEEVSAVDLAEEDSLVAVQAEAGSFFKYRFKFGSV